jgi:hypothetical protein
MRPTGHTSDTFKFHLHKLIKLGYVVKLSEEGTYKLTSTGKRFANSLDEQHRTERKQPKLSVLIIGTKEGVNNEKLFLLQKRQRQPYFGFWGEITSPVRWGWPFLDVAAMALAKQTGLQAKLAIQGMRRTRDFNTETEELFEDKLFIVIEATNLTGELRQDYPSGINAWMTLDQLKQETYYFPTTPRNIQAYLDGDFYIADDLFYKATEY